MKILLLANTVGVIYKFRFELVETLIEKGHEVHVIAYNENEDYYVSEMKKIGVSFYNVEITRRGKNPFSELVLIYNYYKNIRKINPNFTYIYTIKPNIYGSLICRILNINYVNTVTGVGTSFQNTNILAFLLKNLLKISFDKSKKVFFQNKDNLDLFLKLGIVKESNVCLVAGSGVNVDKYQPMKKTIVKNYPVILFIGRIMKEKGIYEYLEVSKHFFDKKIKVEFQVLGQCEEEEAYQKVLEYHKENYITYMGVVDDTRDIIKNCDIVINPSWHEGMSNVLLEAGAMGKILIGSDISGIREIINDENMLFKVNSSEMIIEILKKTMMNNLMNYEQYNHIISNFSRISIIEKYLDELK